MVWLHRQPPTATCHVARPNFKRLTQMDPQQGGHGHGAGHTSVITTSTVCIMHNLRHQRTAGRDPQPVNSCITCSTSHRGPARPVTSCSAVDQQQPNQPTGQKKWWEPINIGIFWEFAVGHETMRKFDSPFDSSTLQEKSESIWFKAGC